MDLVEQLTDYHCLSKKHEMGFSLDTANDPPQDVLRLEHSILHYYSLPFAYQFSILLRAFSQDCPISAKKINTIIAKLETVATAYLSSPPHSNLSLLRSAQNKLAASISVLPVMGFSNTSYQNYLFECILIRAQHSPKDVLAELEISEVCKDEIAVAFSENTGHTDFGAQDHLVMVSKLKHKGLLYIDGYAGYLASEKVGQEVWHELYKVIHYPIDTIDKNGVSRSDYSGEYPYPKTVTLQTTYWKNLLFSKTHITICCFSKLGNEWVRFKIRVHYEVVLQFIERCEQVNLAAKVRRQCIAYFKKKEPQQNGWVSIWENGKQSYLKCDIGMHCIKWHRLFYSVTSIA